MLSQETSLSEGKALQVRDQARSGLNVFFVRTHFRPSRAGESCFSDQLYGTAVLRRWSGRCRVPFPKSGGRPPALPDEFSHPTRYRDRLASLAVAAASPIFEAVACNPEMYAPIQNGDLVPRAPSWQRGGFEVLKPIRSWDSITPRRRSRGASCLRVYIPV